MAGSRQRRRREVHLLEDYEEARTVEAASSSASSLRTSPSKRCRIAEGMDYFNDIVKLHRQIKIIIEKNRCI